MTRPLALAAAALALVSVGFLIGRYYERKQSDYIHMWIDDKGFHVDGRCEK